MDRRVATSSRDFHTSSHRPARDQVRKVATTLDNAKSLLRVMEFMAAKVPEAFLSPSCTLNLTR